MANGDPLDMLNRLRTGSPSPVESGGVSASVAVEGGAVSPPPSTPAGSSVDSSVTLHLPSEETTSCPNVAWGAVRKPPRPSLTMGTGLREEVMRRRHSDWRYGPPVPPKTKSRTPGVGKAKEK